MKITVVKSNHLYSNSKFNKPSCIRWPENNKLTCWDKLYEQYNIKMLVCKKAKLTICLRYRIISFPFDTKHYQLLQYLYYPGKDFKLTAALFRSKSHIIQSNRSSLWGNCNTFFKYIVNFLSHRRPEGFKVPFFFIYYNSWRKEVKKIQIDDLRDILSHWCLRPFDEVLFWDPEALKLMI